MFVLAAGLAALMSAGTAQAASIPGQAGVNSQRGQDSTVFQVRGHGGHHGGMRGGMRHGRGHGMGHGMRRGGHHGRM